jgi:hypothetical protein
MPQSIAQIKHKLRALKHLEIAVRFKGMPPSGHRPLIWDAFFSTRSLQDASVKYPLGWLQQKGHEELKEVFEEYFYRVYFQHFQECGLSMEDMYDPALLSLLGLPPYAGLQDIKQRYRALAQKYHPDHGGDHEKFVELVDVYERITGK